MKLWLRVWCLVFLTHGVVSDIHISQGSVATYFRCGGIFRDKFVANLPVSRQ